MLDLDGKKFIPIKLLVPKAVVNETLSRIGIANKRDKVLWPSCYIWDKFNDTFLLHFKQCFILANKSYGNISDEDLIRRNSIAFCLKNWRLN